MKKIVTAIMVMLFTSSLYAGMNTIKPNAANTEEEVHWAFGKDDGMFFLLGPESTNALYIHVNKYSVSGLPTDPLTVNCNDTTYKLTSDTTVTCYPNFSDVISIGVRVEDYKFGSEGVYRYVPLTAKK